MGASLLQVVVVCTCKRWCPPGHGPRVNPVPSALLLGFAAAGLRFAGWTLVRPVFGPCTIVYVCANYTLPADSSGTRRSSRSSGLSLDTAVPALAKTWPMRTVANKRRSVHMPSTDALPACVCPALWRPAWLVIFHGFKLAFFCNACCRTIYVP
jgi:hypothetical protein